MCDVSSAVRRGRASGQGAEGLLEEVPAALLRAGDAVVRAWSIDMTALSSTLVERALRRCTEAYEALVGSMEEPDVG